MRFTFRETLVDGVLNISRMSPNVVILASLLSSSVTSLSLVGYKFTDNLLEKRFGPDNGYITFKVDRVPHQISACFRIYIDFRRFSYQGYMDFSKEGQPEPFTTITSKEILSCAPASPATENMILYNMDVQIKLFNTRWGTLSTLPPVLAPYYTFVASSALSVPCLVSDGGHSVQQLSLIHI